MRTLYPFEKRIRLHVKERIAPEDAARQERTAREILRRLHDQPGVILADEVGMGKTFVALAVAASVALANKPRRPVVVMVPPSLKEKWPTDFELFREKCLPSEIADRLPWAHAEDAVEFLKRLDDPPQQKKAILFVTHGAMSRGLSDGWVKLALIHQALRGRRGADRKRREFGRFMGPLLRMKGVERGNPDIWEDLLRTHPSQWLNTLHAWDIDPEGDDGPVPRAVYEVLPRLDTSCVYECLHNVPRRRSKHLEDRLINARSVLNQELREVWKECVTSLRLKLPLLILDEAHHLKNPKTRLASLFDAPEAESDADEITRGPLGGVFERMLFLTATPFQLGHGELCSTLDRFGSIRWRGRLAPGCGKEGVGRRLKALRVALDAAQEAALSLDFAWGRLRPEDLNTDGSPYEGTDDWWEAAEQGALSSPVVDQVRHCYRNTRERMRMAERLLQPWVIRHRKQPYLPRPFEGVARRRRLPGRSICEDESSKPQDGGIPVAGATLLPFLLAARATTCAPESRPVFAEGLASSYEAFLHTRSARASSGKQDVTDGDDDEVRLPDATKPMKWYLGQLESMLPQGDLAASAAHPKVAATLDRVVRLWSAGEKVVVFCHYIATGRILRRLISDTINREIRQRGAEQLACAPDEVHGRLEQLGKRFFAQKSPLRRACDAETTSILSGYPELRSHRDGLLDIVRRNLRTPSFLVRFFPLGRPKYGEDALLAAMDREDQSGQTLQTLLRDFFAFLVRQCGAEDRRRHIDAVSRIQTGSHIGGDVAAVFAEDELQGERPDRLSPAVRLVNGATKPETRQRLMLAFNTPFYPEILVASSVMAEGVDLHLNCRYTIHHDLCWNPSTLEQRTGRIDRIGAKAERTGKPIFAYLPYVAETQDEKMYRVVMDRERWFNVVMGENYSPDARTTERLCNRVPLPQSVAHELAFRLEVC